MLGFTALARMPLAKGRAGASASIPDVVIPPGGGGADGNWWRSPPKKRRKAKSIDQQEAPPEAPQFISEADQAALAALAEQHRVAVANAATAELLHQQRMDEEAALFLLLAA